MVEYFAILDPKCIALSNNDRTITKINSRYWRNSCYGAQLIDPFDNKGHFKWWVRIDNESADPEFGFHSHFDDTDSANGVRPFYKLNTSSGCIYTGPTGDRDYPRLIEEFALQKGDIICLEFIADGDSSSIRFSVDGRSQELIFKANEIELHGFKYRMCVSICRKGGSASIVDFECLRW